ncbi:MAG: hypothetical protein ABID45_01020 [Patescibacteria group bacterium]
MIFKRKNTKEVIRDGFTAHIYNSKKEYPALDTILVDCHTSHKKVYVKESHRVYFVIEGNGTFDVGDETYEVTKEDVIVIEPKVKYAYKGKMKLFELNFPSTSSDDEVAAD